MSSSNSLAIRFEITELLNKGYDEFFPTVAIRLFPLLGLVILTETPFFRFFWKTIRSLSFIFLLTIFSACKLSEYIRVNP